MTGVLTIDDLIADKKHSNFFAEVVTGKSGGVASGLDISTSTNQVTGQVQKTLPQVLADLGMVVQTWTATSGGTLTNAAQVFLNDKAGSNGLGNYYAWSGTFPKVVTAGLDPAITAGFIMRSDAGLRAQLGGIGSKVLVAGTEAGAIASFVSFSQQPYGAHLIGNSTFYVEDILSVDVSNIPPYSVIMARTRAGKEIGGGEFFYTTSTSRQVDNGTVFPPAVGSGRLVRRGCDVLTSASLGWFGAVLDGSTDDSLAINTAINSSYSSFYSPVSSLIRITSNINIVKSNVTLDFNYSEIRLDDPSGLKSHVVIGDGASTVNVVNIKNVTFTRTQVATSGSAVSINKAGYVNLSNSRVYGDSKIFNGLSVNVGTIVNIFDCIIENCVSNGVFTQGVSNTANNNKAIDVRIDRCRISGNNMGINAYSYTEGLFIRNTILYGNISAQISISAASNAAGLVSFKIQECDIDSPVGNGVFISNVSNVQFTDNWISLQNVSAFGLRSDSAVDGLVIAGNQVYMSQTTGFTSKAFDIFSLNTIVTDNLISGGAEGVTVNSTADHVVVSGNRIVGQRDTGVNLYSNPTYALVTNNSISGQTNKIGGSGGTGSLVANNITT